MANESKSNRIVTIAKSQTGGGLKTPGHCRMVVVVVAVAFDASWQMESSSAHRAVMQNNFRVIHHNDCSEAGTVLTLLGFFFSCYQWWWVSKSLKFISYTRVGVSLCDRQSESELKSFFFIFVLHALLLLVSIVAASKVSTQKPQAWEMFR